MDLHKHKCLKKTLIKKTKEAHELYLGPQRITYKVSYSSIRELLGRDNCIAIHY